MKKNILLLAIGLVVLPYLARATEVEIQHLKVENLVEPLGLDVATPRFSWQMAVDDHSRGYEQKAYRITVTDEKQQPVWDSGRVESGRSVFINYEGNPLKATTRYSWTVSVWDQTGKVSAAGSWFETGLMNPSLMAWNGAKWIGGSDDDLILYSDYQLTFVVGYTLQLDQKSKSSKASFVLGANDPRLMDRYKNIYGLSNGENESYIAFSLDISPIITDKSALAKMKVYRVGYHADDKADTPLFSFDIPQALINESNMYQPHSVRLEVVSGLFDIFIDGTSESNKITTHNDPGGRFNAGKSFNLNPLGKGGDFIAFPALAHIGFATEAGQTACFGNLTIGNFRNPSHTLFEEKAGAGYDGIFAGYAGKGVEVVNGNYKTGGKHAVFAVANPSRNGVPMLRKTFTADRTLKKARLYVTSRGIYEICINGKRVGEDYFNSGLSQYNKTHFYQTYNVTSLVKQGQNAIGAMLGEGWWSGPSTFVIAMWNFFGDRQALMAKLVLTYEDGTEHVIATNNTWKFYNDGPVRLGSFFQGEVYDATKEMAVKGWDTPGFDDRNWSAATEQHEDGVAKTDKFHLVGSFTPLNGYDRVQYTGWPGENPQVVRELTAQHVKEVRKGVFVYDMGQNMVGVPEIKVNGKAGDQVVVRYAEVCYPDFPEYAGQNDLIMTENLRAAFVQDIYTLKGRNDVIAPRFTFHGYRYVEIRGIDHALPLENVKGKVISSMHHITADYHTSNQSVNRLWQNIVWSSYGNFISIPTDCPQRNERMGWSGDFSIFAKTATYVGGLNAFFDRHLLALRDTQREDGRYADVAPLGGGFGGVLWGSVGIVAPWEMYCQYGDSVGLARHYESMKRYMQYFADSIDPETNVTTDGTLGDWLSPVNGKNDNSLLFESYYIHELEIMSKAATVLGYEKDAKHYEALRKERVAHFHRTWLDDQQRTICSGIVPATFGKKLDPADYAKGKRMDTQVSYAVPLALGVINDAHRQSFAKNFVETVRRQDTDDSGVLRPAYSLLTGFIGTACISNALTENGYNADAYRLLLNNQYPSWLYPVENGATTIWERLNSYTAENGFGGNNGMNSFNHYSFGAVGAWMINHSAGIQRDENSPGFKHFIIAPQPDPDAVLKYAEGYYHSPYGRIYSKWAYNDAASEITYTVVIPANTSATFRFPANGAVTVSDKTGITVLEHHTFELVSGTYQFVQKAG